MTKITQLKLLTYFLGAVIVIQTLVYTSIILDRDKEIKYFKMKNVFLESKISQMTYEYKIHCYPFSGGYFRETN